MARRAFYSFHYAPDNWRAAQVRNMGVIEGNRPASDNDWESIKRKGDAAIEAWIDGQLVGKSCTIVLIGSNTANRKWINYEIKETWKTGKGLLGVYIHNLEDRDGKQSLKGKNPFDYLTLGGESMARIVPAYNPPYTRSVDVYAHIKENLAEWIEEGIRVRNRYSR
jgi:antiphage defense system Thoeris ThsB-like protein